MPKYYSNDSGNLTSFAGVDIIDSEVDTNTSHSTIDIDISTQVDTRFEVAHEGHCQSDFSLADKFISLPILCDYTSVTVIN